MKLLTLEDAICYKLDDTKHISNKKELDINRENYKTVTYNINNWNTNITNEEGEELVILYDDEGYWQPYIEWLFKLQNIPINTKYIFGYIDGTHHHLGNLKNTHSGMMSTNNYNGYQIWVMYEVN